MQEKTADKKKLGLLYLWEHMVTMIIIYYLTLLQPKMYLATQKKTLYSNTKVLKGLKESDPSAIYSSDNGPENIKGNLHSHHLFPITEF